MVAGFALAAGVAVAGAPPASARILLVPVPPGCGNLSATMVLSTRLDDHSADPGPLGVVGGAPFQVPAAADRITVGTAFVDHIRGNGVSETICGLGGGDTLEGGAGGVDVIFDGPDTIHGNEPGDIIEGGQGANSLFGGQGIDTCAELGVIVAR